MKDWAYGIAINLMYNGYQGGLACILYKFFGKKAESGASVNEELPQELTKQWLKNFKKWESMRDLKIIFGQQN